MKTENQESKGRSPPLRPSNKQDLSNNKKKG